MTPEGQVLLFVFAGREEDHVCARAIDYLRRLEELDLEIYFGCEGMQARGLAHSAQDAEDLLIDSVWDTPSRGVAVNPTELDQFITTCNGLISGSKIERVLIFSSPERITDSETLGWFCDIGQRLEQLMIVPVFIITAKNRVAHKQPAETTATLSNKVGEYLKYLLIEDGKRKETGITSKYYHDFLNYALSRNWDVLV
jgi:hypothetical protein